MAIKYPDRIESNNPLAYGIVKATEISGQRWVEQLSDLYKLSDAILSESKTGEDAEGLIWIVGKDLYQLISWLNRNKASGWLKVIPFNEKMFDRFYNLDGNMINSLTGYTKATELLNLLENDSLLNALGKLEYKADLTYDLVNSVYEGVHTIEELREMLNILEEIQNSSELLNSYLSNYLPLAGGTMTGNLIFNNKSTTKTPHIIFERGTGSDDYYDYHLYYKSGAIKIEGIFSGGSTGSGGTLPLLDIHYQNGATFHSTLTATKFIKNGGTSSQFLKADGSLDSNSYATLNEEGQVERAILADDLGGREETREEQFTYQATANDESVKDGLAVVKSIKGNTVVTNEGSLLNLNADSIKGVGFNAYNGEYAKVLGGMQYYLGGNITSLTFKENLEDEGEVIEIPSNRLYTPTTNGYLVASGDNICINLSHSGYRNGEYEPYKENIANLPPIKDYFTNGMKSAGEVRDEIVWNGKKYKTIQRIGSVDMGTLQWREFTPFKAFTSDSLNSIIPHRHVNLVTPKYKCSTNSQFQVRPFVDELIATNELGTIMVRDYSITTLSEFTTFIAGQILYYELETPIETIIDDYDLIDYEVSDFGTEEIIADEPTTPIIADIQYGFNAVDEIRDHRFGIKRLNKKINELTALVESLLATLDVNYEELN